MNPSDVRTFRAHSMQAALERVRQELGPDAVILHTRELPQPRFFVWKRSDDRVEITAGVGINVPTPRALAQPAARAYAAASALRRAADAPSRPASPTAGRSENPSVPAEPATANHPRPHRNAMPVRPAQPETALERGDDRIAPSGQRSHQPAALRESGTIDSTQIARQLGSIQKMVERLSQSAMPRGEEIDSQLFHLYAGLIDAEVDEDLARDMICQLKQEQTGPIDAVAARKRLAELVEKSIQVAAPILPARGRRKVVALVGPTGVGKTTTIAKLAANFRLRDNVRLGLVTVDTYRIAAVEQLRTYAEIIDLPMKVVTSPREMGRALDELAGLDLILIDTAGRSPRDELKIQELKSLLSEAQVDEVHLVLSMVSSVKTLQATAEKFASAGCTAMVLTKLDEAVSMGPLLSVAHRLPLPISYVTTGQDVPDDIEPANNQRLGRLVLGDETLFSRR